MISVMSEFEMDRNPTSARDISFFGIESPNDDAKMDPIEREIPSSLDLLVESDLEEARVRVSPTGDNQQHPRSPPPRVSEPNEIPIDMNGLVTGDMVWGKVKSHPWWPGHIFNESFASPSVRRTKSDGFVLVAFFGDSSYGWFDPAELIPYEPNFLEKSKQTTLRSFVKAVEESIDETSRRAALGLSCRCRNPYNFRPTKDPNYFEVDVVGYERNGIYSKRQTNRERNSFEPKDALSFLHQLAVMPRANETQDVEWHRNVAVALAVRSRRYEEFDETYAQAFGQEPVRPVRNEMGVPEQAESFTPRVALFSGPLVFAEALGVKKKSISKHFASSSSSTFKSSLHKEKDKSAKRNKYVLKRRDEHNSSPLPDAYFSQQQQQQQQQPPSFIITDSTAENSDYVLQKREAAEDSKPDLSTAFNIDQKNNAESPHTPPLPVTENDVDEKPASCADGDAIKKQKEKKIKKRSLEDVADHEAKMLKKKKKKKEYRDGLLASEAGHETSRASENFIPSPRPVSPPAVDLGPLDQLDLLSVFGDLKSLALNPFYGIEHKTPLIARHVFLRFRSLVYSKSLVLPAPSEADAQAEVQLSKPAAASIAPVPSNKDAKEQQRDQGSSSKPAKLMKRADDPTKGGKKRAPSDRQEEMSAKRMKKVSQMKSLASEKKAALTQKTSDGPKGPSTAEPTKKPEKQEPLLPTPPKRESPTYLIMKFPRGSTLPSVANLKARFARFGPLAVDSTRVFWKSHSCRVQFKYKPDALRALSYVKSNDIFGQVQVDYSVREVEVPAPEPQPEPAQFRPGNGSGSSSAAQSRHGSQQSQPQGKLKSILKKPGDEAGKENQRVKFMLSDSGNGDNSKLDSPPPPLSASGGAGFTDVAPPQSRPSKSTSFQLDPPPPPPQPRQTLMQPPLPPLPPARSYEPHHVLHPPPQHLQMPLPPPAPLRPSESRQGPPAQFSEARHQVPEVKSRNKNVDISHQMMSLLLRCNDIVSSLRSLPGFVPYRPL